MIQVAVAGVGRAGAEVIRELAVSSQFRLAAAFCRDGSEKAGKKITTLLPTAGSDVIVSEISHAKRVLKDTHADVLIDFSSPVNAMPLVRACSALHVPSVICTTGFTADELSALRSAVLSAGACAVYAPNVTLGVNVLIAALKIVARALPEFDYRITETHHNKKYDKPSGTARVIADAIENELETEDAKRYVPIHSIRAGGYIGLHEVLLANDCERLSFTHESFNRRAFARGALAAARFAIGKTGWFGMEDVVDIGPHPEHKFAASSEAS